MDLTPTPLFLAQWLEALMLICFGVAWPMNLISMLRCQRVQGKGLTFTTIIWCGYLAGATAKLALWTGTDAPLSPVFWLYMFNSVTVGLNAWLYFRLQNKELATRQLT